jgi:hypothetical protein
MNKEIQKDTTPKLSICREMCRVGDKISFLPTQSSNDKFQPMREAEVYRVQKISIYRTYGDKTFGYSVMVDGKRLEENEIIQLAHKHGSKHLTSFFMRFPDSFEGYIIWLCKDTL